LSGCASISVDQIVQPDGTRKITVWEGMFNSKTFYLKDGQEFTYIVNRKTGDVQIVIANKYQTIEILKDENIK
jgi:hypothetical protein